MNSDELATALAGHQRAIEDVLLSGRFTIKSARSIAIGRVLALRSLLERFPDASAEIEALIDVWSELDDPTYGPPDS